MLSQATLCKASLTLGSAGSGSLGAHSVSSTPVQTSALYVAQTVRHVQRVWAQPLRRLATSTERLRAECLDSAGSSVSGKPPCRETPAFPVARYKLD